LVVQKLFLERDIGCAGRACLCRSIVCSVYDVVRGRSAHSEFWQKSPGDVGWINDRDVSFGLMLGLVPTYVLLPLLAAILLVSAVKVWRHQ
jgi:hypothetical protein